MTPGAGPRSASSRRWAAVVVLTALVFTAFAPVMNAGFIGLDDPQYVSGNDHVLTGLSARGFTWALTTFEAANWHPLTWLSHMLDVTLFGPRAGPHHRVNVALHAASAVLLFLLLERLTGAWGPALLTAALFAVHPLRVESVAWISERKDLLSGLLAMLTLLAYVRYARRPGPRRYLVVVTALALGLMAKPMLVTLPFVLLLLDWWPLGRLRPPSGWGRLLVEKAPLLLLSVASSIVTFVAQKHGGAMAAATVFPLAMRLSNACVSYVTYLGKMILPRDLIPFYPHPGFVLTPTQTVLSAVLLVGLTTTAFAVRGRRPWLLTGWLWYLGTLVPVIGLVQVGLQGMADRYTYLPLIGLFAAVAWEAHARGGQTPRSRGVLGVLGVLAAGAVATFALLTWQQSNYWKGTSTLFARVVAVDSRNYLAFNMLGSEHLQLGAAARARTLFEKSLALKPDYLPARYNLGLALATSGEKQAAIEQFTALIFANAKDAESLYNRGKLLLATGKPEEALRDFESARELSPRQPQIHVSRGLALARLGRPTEAAGAFGEAIAIEPRNAEMHYNLGMALESSGHFQEAQTHYRAALDLDPGFAQAHNMLGVTLAKQGRLPEGLVHFREAVRLAPSDAGARANLDRATATLGGSR